LRASILRTDSRYRDVPIRNPLSSLHTKTRRAAAVAAVALIAASLTAQQAEPPPLAGFAPDAAQTEQQWEQKFRAIPSTDNMRDFMKFLSAHPHHVGSPYDQQIGDWLAARFMEWGWDTRVESFQVLFPTPTERVVELIEPTHFVAKLAEPPLPDDSTSNQQAEQLPPYNAYSIDGDVTAPLVYVNYGVPSDYDELDRMGISVKGAIVIARYGASWRGVKPKIAAEHGAVGCLIYSDPHEDGYTAGDVFPKGAWRPPDSVQRGSVVDMPLYPGDPLTPGVAATPDAKRLTIQEAKVITKIPVLPLSYADAQPLLAAIAGQVAPESWRGGLGITYHVGPGPAKVHLRVKSSWDMKTIRDIVATIPGSTAPAEWVIRGNHYDAWVNGARDPVSGLVAELEEARALGEMRKAGWQPKRTIIYTAWDGEEPGLLGSTEWVEKHAAELAVRAVAYINSDSNGRGYLEPGGSQSLDTFVNDVAKDIPDPEAGMSVWRRKQIHEIASVSSEEERNRVRSRSSWPIDALGSGSDYTAFLDFAGVPSLNFAYGGDEESNGVYHSAYDDFYWFTHFDDPTFVYERALAQTSGTAVMRLADASLLPFNFGDLSNAVSNYVGEVQRLATRESANIRERNREIASGEFAYISASGGRPAAVPQPKPEPVSLDFAALQAARDQLVRASARYQQSWERGRQNSSLLARGDLEKINEELFRSEHALIDSNGLPGRPWYKHQLYAPGFYTGYAVKTIPAVREAIEQDQWALAQQTIGSVSKIISDEATVIDHAATDLDTALQ
jgi:N-acetylated-alpha-linked acidic dipeptidase